MYTRGRPCTPNLCRHLTVSHFSKRGIFPMETPRRVSRPLASDRTQARLLQSFNDCHDHACVRISNQEGTELSSIRMMALEPTLQSSALEASAPAEWSRMDASGGQRLF